MVPKQGKIIEYLHLPGQQMCVLKLGLGPQPLYLLVSHKTLVSNHL